MTNNSVASAALAIAIVEMAYNMNNNNYVRNRDCDSKKNTQSAQNIGAETTINCKSCIRVYGNST